MFQKFKVKNSIWLCWLFCLINANQLIADFYNQILSDPIDHEQQTATFRHRWPRTGESCSRLAHLASWSSCSTWWVTVNVGWHVCSWGVWRPGVFARRASCSGLVNTWIKGAIYIVKRHYNLCHHKFHCVCTCSWIRWSSCLWLIGGEKLMVMVGKHGMLN